MDYCSQAWAWSRFTNNGRISWARNQIQNASVMMRFNFEWSLFRNKFDMLPLLARQRHLSKTRLTEIIRQEKLDEKKVLWLNPSAVNTDPSISPTVFLSDDHCDSI